jgi:hypothetical protein
MAKRLPYSAWARMQLEIYPEEVRQKYRASYFSDSWKIKQYDRYREDCKRRNLDFDMPPEGYWDTKKTSWDKPLSYAIGGMGVLTWFLASIVGGSTGRR